MLTKSQANAVADALVEGGQAKRMAQLELRAARIPLYYQSKALSRLPAWRQARLVAEARRTAGFTWAAIGASGCMLLVALVLWFSTETRRPVVTLWPAVLVMGVASVLVRLLVVRLWLQELLLKSSHRKRAMVSNPSIERTSYSRLRLLPLAAHVER